MRSHRLGGTLLMWLDDIMLLAWILLMYGNRYSGQPGVSRSTATSSSSARISSESGSSLPSDKQQTPFKTTFLASFSFIYYLIIIMLRNICTKKQQPQPSTVVFHTAVARPVIPSVNSRPSLVSGRSLYVLEHSARWHSVCTISFCLL